jgi:hypothetical protein
VRPKGVGKLKKKKIIELIGNRTATFREMEKKIFKKKYLHLRELYSAQGGDMSQAVP